ncbi:protein ELYS [Nilaparvata lugens]|uniref:protein ELYS n=1 Tax=Nilaparvata lugens TaxID=108931 RepID=UPI00193E97E1|nr:protein ELYS [Nilaparvata lugens]
MNKEGSVLHITSNLKISSRIDDKYLQDEHSLDEHFEVNGKIFTESNFLCINCGPQVSILRNRNGSKYSFWSADQTTRDTVTKITCIIEVNIGTGVPLLAAGTDEGLLCFYYTGVSRILRAVQFGQKIVSLALLDNGDHSAVGNWVTLPEELAMMNGVLAVGLDGGAVYLVDMCHHWLKLSIQKGGPVTIEIPSQLLLINLRTDTANDIQAKKEYADCHPGETLAIFLNESNLDQFRKVMASHLGSPVYRRSLDNSVDEFHLVVTALAYFKEIACLAVGFNTGCFQLWHMSLFRLIYMSPLMQDTQLMPVAGFSWQEPTDDPHSVCFIWAAHQSPSHLAARPFAAMYMTSFTTKRHIDGYGCFYENYKGCQRKYELGLGDDMDSVIDGRIISCQSISKLIQRRLPHCSIQASNEDESIVSVCAIAWEVWTPERTNVISKLTLFDINQWYRAQMPYSLESGDSNSYVANLLLPSSNEEHPEPLLDVCISAESLSQFSAYQPLDEHYFPLSLSLACTCLYEHRKVECAWKGVQMELLTALDQAGPSALIDPSRYCSRFLAVGLKPSFYDAADSANLSVVTERQMLLTVMVEQGWMSFVRDCVRAWADGCLAVANCTLPTLLKWGWSAVTFYKQMADNICIQLFDLRTTPSMKEFIYVVSLLHKLSEIFDFILKNYRNFILEDNVELQSISLQLYIEYLDSVVWSTKHHLLPEVNEPSSSLPDIFQYPQLTLQNNVIERREKMRQLSRKLLEVNPQLCLADLLVVDSLLKTTAGGRRIISQWEAEGSAVGGLYPPPSLQSILRIFLVRGVATHFKHMLIYYFLLDVVDLQQDHPSAAKMLQNFVTKFRLTKSQVLITKAFWLIDHGKLKEAVDHFTNNTVCQNDMTETNHKTVMHSLFVQGEPKLALIYSRAFNPLLSELEDAKFHILILLECGHILQAFDFQRKYRQWQTELLDLFFTGKLNLLSKYYYFIP